MLRQNHKVPHEEQQNKTENKKKKKQIDKRQINNAFWTN